MPLSSREVVTLQLILDCEEEEGDNIVTEDAHAVSPLLRLPVELRLKILRYLLRIDRNRKGHTRRPPANSISELLFLNPRRILEAAPFKHKGSQEVNGSPPIISSCRLCPAILNTCKQLYWEGKAVLYDENRLVGLQSGIRGLGAKLKNYGVPIWGPLPAARLISSLSAGSPTDLAKFDPVMLFTGQNAKPNTPLYVCSYKEAADLMHALWIMIESPFARGMRYNLTISAGPRYRHVDRIDSFLKFAVLPWLHSHINSINFHGPAPVTPPDDEVQVKSRSVEARLESLRDELKKHVTATNAEPNLHTYRAICAYLERVLHQAEICVEQRNFLSAELLFERVGYEASSIVRTRTSKLVDVSAKSKDGINRVCKLIAVSAYRLCELRSGALARMVSRKPEKAQAEAKIIREVASVENDQVKQNLIDETNENVEDPSSAAADADIRTSVSEESLQKVDDLPANNLPLSNSAQLVALHESTVPFVPRTTRLEPLLARDLAITSGLLALRLPCASPVPEWNIRLDIMLLRLFAERNDVTNAVWSIRRIQSNCNLELKEAKSKNKPEGKWQPLSELLSDLTNQLRPSAPRGCFFETADKCEKVVTGLWGDRLVPKKGFNGLIWTFRWAG